MHYYLGLIKPIHAAEVEKVLLAAQEGNVLKKNSKAKKFRHERLESIKGIGPHTAKYFKKKGIKSVSDLKEYINTHTYDQWLHDFKGFKKRKHLGKKLYKQYGNE